MATAKGKPCLSTRMLIFIPLTFFPPSIPRFPQVGDDRQDRLSATRTEGLDLSPQATRHLRRRSTTRPFQRPRRFPDHLSVFCCALLTQRLGVCLKESSCG